MRLKLKEKREEQTMQITERNEFKVNGMGNAKPLGQEVAWYNQRTPGKPGWLGQKEIIGDEVREIMR